jgi:hypothetical protein
MHLRASGGTPRDSNGEQMPMEITDRYFLRAEAFLHPILGRKYILFEPGCIIKIY